MMKSDWRQKQQKAQFVQVVIKISGSNWIRQCWNHLNSDVTLEGKQQQNSRWFPEAAGQNSIQTKENITLLLHFYKSRKLLVCVTETLLQWWIAHYLRKSSGPQFYKGCMVPCSGCGWKSQPLKCSHTFTRLSPWCRTNKKRGRVHLMQSSQGAVESAYKSHPLLSNIEAHLGGMLLGVRGRSCGILLKQNKKIIFFKKVLWSPRNWITLNSVSFFCLISMYLVGKYVGCNLSAKGFWK